jgi:hypothetical protein
MDEKTYQRWVELEASLVECARSLCQYATSKNVVFPRGFDITNERFLPKAFNYGRAFATKDESRRAVKLSSYAFQLLFAGLSFVMASVMQDGDDPDHPSWAIHLQDVRHVEPTLLDQIKTSPLCDPTAKRVGAFVVRGTSLSWARYIPLMERFSCPLFIHWNESGWWDRYVELSKYRPVGNSKGVSPSSSSNPLSSQCKSSFILSLQVLICL